jgi:hypothetical protein
VQRHFSTPLIERHICLVRTHSAVTVSFLSLVGCSRVKKKIKKKKREKKAASAAALLFLVHGVCQGHLQPLRVAPMHVGLLVGWNVAVHVLARDLPDVENDIMIHSSDLCTSASRPRSSRPPAIDGTAAAAQGEFAVSCALAPRGIRSAADSLRCSLCE